MAPAVRNRLDSSVDAAPFSVPRSPILGGLGRGRVGRSRSGSQDGPRAARSSSALLAACFLGASMLLGACGSKDGGSSLPRDNSGGAEKPAAGTPVAAVSTIPAPTPARTPGQGAGPGPAPADAGSVRSEPISVQTD